MKPIRSALKRVRFLSDIPEMDSPPIRTSPLSNPSRPERQLRSVVFPHPEGPMTATISPRWILKSTPRRARTLAPPASKLFSTPRASTIAVPMPSSCAISSLAFLITVRSFSVSSLPFDTHVVRAARNGDVVAVHGVLAAPASEDQFAARGADAPVVEGQVGDAAFHAEPRSDPFGAADGDVAGATEDDHGHGARGIGEHHLQAASATIYAQRSEP